MSIRKDVLLALVLGVLRILDDMSRKKKTPPGRSPKEGKPYNGVTLPVQKWNRKAKPFI